MNPLTDIYNDYWQQLPLYRGRPFVFFHDGRHNYKHITKQYFSVGLLVDYNEFFLKHRNRYYIHWNHQSKPLEYTHKQLYHERPLMYGYTINEKVRRVTDGEYRTISNIGMGECGPFTQTYEDGNEAKFSYNLFIPLPETRHKILSPLGEHLFIL